MTFKGEAVILVETVFHNMVRFTDKNVLINGKPIYRRGHSTLSSDTSPKFKHAPPTGRERDFLTPQVFLRNIQFTNAAGVTRFVTGGKVEFSGRVSFEGSVSLVNPEFRQAVEFAVEPEIRELEAEE